MGAASAPRCTGEDTSADGWGLLSMGVARSFPVSGSVSAINALSSGLRAQRVRRACCLCSCGELARGLLAVRFSAVHALVHVKAAALQLALVLGAGALACIGPAHAPVMGRGAQILVSARRLSPSLARPERAPSRGAELQLR